MFHNKIYIKLFFILGIGLSIILLAYFYFNNNKTKPIIKYTSNTTKQFYWIVEEGTSIYYIRPSANDYIENINSDKYFKNLLAQQQFKNYYFKKNKFEFNHLSISEDILDNRFLVSHKYSYDMNIDSEGEVISNAYYPENKIGGYKFKLAKNDFELLKNILNQISINEFRNNLNKTIKTNQAIILNNRYILNDTKEINSKIEKSSIIMFSNYITMKYLDKLEPNNTTYNIESSKYITTKPKDEEVIKKKIIIKKATSSMKLLFYLK